MERMLDFGVLVLEDDYFIAGDLERSLESVGLRPIGPVADPGEARRLAETEAIKFALLDINLGGEANYSLAEYLSSRDIPFAFATGYGRDDIPKRFWHVLRFQKPFAATDLAGFLKDWATARKPADPVAAKPPSNLILRALAEPVLEDLRRHMTRMVLKPGTVLVEPERPIERVYFPETGPVSILAPDSRRQTDLAMVGSEGMIGSELALGVGVSPLGVVAQVLTETVAVPADMFRAELGRHPDLARRIAQFHYVLGLQIAGTAMANAVLTIEQRLARWILMCSDRVGPEIRITHDVLAAMLSVRRAGITNATHVLEGERAIRSTRGLIAVRDRTRLESFAGESYGVPERAYERLFGVDPSHRRGETEAPAPRPARGMQALAQ